MDNLNTRERYRIMETFFDHGILQFKDITTIDIQIFLSAIPKDYEPPVCPSREDPLMYLMWTGDWKNPISLPDYSSYELSAQTQELCFGEGDTPMQAYQDFLFDVINRCATLTEFLNKKRALEVDLLKLFITPVSGTGDKKGLYFQRND